MTAGADRILRTIASEIRARTEQVKVAIDLIDEGATVPFVARYRKEATGGLDDTQLRQLEERLVYLRELEARRATILDGIRSQGKLTEDLEAKIVRATTKTELEDIYLPFRPKRRTRAEIARERGLGPLADAILADRAATPAELAGAYLSELVPDIKTALDGARDILAETFQKLRQKTGHVALPGHQRKRGDGREVFGLFRPWRALRQYAEPSCPCHAPRPQRRCSVARY
jgi:uncharacterized protein